MPSSGTLAVDLGKSLCRVRGTVSDRPLRREGAGAPGLAARDGVQLALDAILPLLADVRPERVGVGAAGALYAAGPAAELARALADAVRAPAAVASDVVSAHVGALGGDAGVLLIAGTGAVALGITAHGHRSVDGWGPDLGDLGSGSWLGREGVRAVLRARDGLGAATPLSDALVLLMGDAESPISWVGQAAAPARLLATFAPAVLDGADQGDPVSVAIRDEAAGLLADTARAAAGDSTAVALHGGLMSHPGFRATVEAALSARGLDARDSRGDALDGAAMIAEGRAPLHERFVHRAE
ncbi:N-acetylglucosamine kinase [Microbacterium sp. ASV81]|uniref:BadF/BadG/BcrA/BcrD ATPase family protein n=1 Tax=Microbacterium capsulatum TaxID=3041921 RepID=A0ABU0XLK2_9MICO|nr:BadF/BadG/BcrA/BcrD ATPase family protein [Microbacterium sp. ASV81]MDQ4214610.1 BadF/BadG/BcrA/BcrD ATPase family protein [Microbacterium sp. ASV81]